jgi:exodeoxyribonuclease V alpha subunit
VCAAMNPETSATLQGIVERLTFVNEENQYVVARLQVPDLPGAATIVGNLPSLTPGETLRVHGAWIQHKKYGPQFQVERFERVVPSTVAGITRYLGSGLIKGIGPVFAARLVEAFGLDTLRVIDEAPERLREVPGIGPLRASRIAAAWAEQRDIRDVMLFLQGHGVSPSHAVKIFRTYGQAAIAAVKANPYRLAQDIYGIGFKTADAIARELGIARDAPQRAEAGILHVLRAMADDGHAYAPERELYREAETTLEIPAELLPAALAEAARQGRVVVETLADGSRAVYLAALHRAESQVAGRLAALLSAPRQAMLLEAESATAWAEDQARLSLAREQRQAVHLALREKVLIVTGGPGTGKTTILGAILRVLDRAGWRMHLAAPTGRAAKRMAEAAGRPATTIHRLLEWNPAQAAFQRNGARPLETDVVIVDEASMLDLVLAAHLLEAIPPPATLLLVGDADQLPSVGPGAVLRDLLDSGCVPSVRLGEVFRQAEQSRIIVNAHRVNRGDLPELPGPEERAASDFHFLVEEDPARIQATLVDLVRRRLPGRYGFEPWEDIQVVTPMHRGPLGAAQLNAVLQAALNPSQGEGREVARGGRIFRVGDRVMQLRNNYDKEVFNGDIGRILAVDAAEQAVRVLVDDREVTYDFGELDEVTLAYAITVHKSQGSEYPCVLLPLHTAHYVMLQRNLLYTAITRAKRLLVIVGTPKALAMAVRNAGSQARYCRLAARLAEMVHSSSKGDPRLDTPETRE